MSARRITTVAAEGISYVVSALFFVFFVPATALAVLGEIPGSNPLSNGVLLGDVLFVVGFFVGAWITESAAKKRAEQSVLLSSEDLESNTPIFVKHLSPRAVARALFVEASRTHSFESFAYPTLRQRIVVLSPTAKGDSLWDTLKVLEDADVVLHFGRRWTLLSRRWADIEALLGGPAALPAKDLPVITQARPLTRLAEPVARSASDPDAIIQAALSVGDPWSVARLAWEFARDGHESLPITRPSVRAWAHTRGLIAPNNAHLGSMLDALEDSGVLVRRGRSRYFSGEDWPALVARLAEPVAA